MNNKEYIDRKPLIEKLERTIINPQTSFINNILIGMLQKAPAADVVEVVRCKDCQYYEPKNSLGTQGICMCGEKEMNYAGEFYPYETDFCSYGKRKEGA